MPGGRSAYLKSKHFPIRLPDRLRLDRAGVGAWLQRADMGASIAQPPNTNPSRGPCYARRMSPTTPRCATVGAARRCGCTCDAVRGWTCWRARVCCARKRTFASERAHLRYVPKVGHSAVPPQLVRSAEPLRPGCWAFASGLATSRAVSINSRAAGLIVRFLRRLRQRRIRPLRCGARLHC
jgi:hypothetical protein